MITAKDIFTLEREHINELQYLLNNSTLRPEELELIVDQLNDPISESEYDELKKKLLDCQLNPRDRIRNGEIVTMKNLNIAVRQAASNG